MAGTYVEISEEQMREFFESQEFGPWHELHLPGTEEIVFARMVVAQGIKYSLRVFTSIAKRDGMGRDKGKDAIRVNLAWKNNNNKVKIVGSSKRVHRVVNWRENLNKRLTEWQEMAPRSCEKCNSPMALRKGKFGKFWGCVEYPNCKNTVKSE